MQHKFLEQKEARLAVYRVAHLYSKIAQAKRVLNIAFSHRKMCWLKRKPPLKNMITQNEASSESYDK